VSERVSNSGPTRCLRCGWLAGRQLAEFHQRRDTIQAKRRRAPAIPAPARRLAIPDPLKGHDTWKTTPRWTITVFLAAVFFIFSTIGFSVDIADLGRQADKHLAIGVLITGGFAVCYATLGVKLRRKFWIAFFPILIVQLLVNIILANVLPDAPQISQLDPVQTHHLHNRMAFDSIAIMIAVILGYIGFITVSVSTARRYARSQLDKAALENEMAAAREVQRVMVPEALPPVSGYYLESVYRPAAEVGGDFFQVIPLASGRTLIVIGDVSGKGLRAAMIVSMIVGMLRTVCDFTEEPAAILAELNRRLFGRTHGGFVTCLMVRVDEQGSLTLANAGHPPPYINGAETAFPGSVPLGVLEIAAYDQTSLQMHVGDEAVLVTDGIAEAQNAQRILLGFPSVESLLREGAKPKQVAEVAQQHGQADDLTVISIARAV
jgi:hypothetical protein